MLFQCGRLEGLHLPYVSLVRATGVGRLSGGEGLVLWEGFSRFIGDT